MPFDCLRDHLLDTNEGLSRQMVEDLLTRLWECHVLQTDLVPPVTDLEPFEWVRSRLGKLHGTRALVVQLDALARLLDECNRTKGGAATAALKKAAVYANQIHATSASSKSLPLQVDTAFHLPQNKISWNIGAEVARLAELLLRQSPQPRGPTYLEAYRNAFIGKYGQDREVPLLELVHPEFGLGPVGHYGQQDATVDQLWLSRRSRALQRAVLAAARSHHPIIDLDAEALGEVVNLTDRNLMFPTSLDLNVFVLSSSISDINRGDFQVMAGPGVGALFAGRHLGRFAHLFGGELNTKLHAPVDRERSRFPDHLFAEVCYLPPNWRSANVIIHRPIADYEVVRGTSPSLSYDSVIALDDLIVGVHDNRFYVRSASLKRKIRFVHAHMLNPTSAPKECYLLTQIGNDGVAQLSAFDWGPLRSSEFLPRIQHGRLILHPAEWRIMRDQVIDSDLANAKSFYDWFSTWCKNLKIGQHVYLGTSDNRLLLDLSDRSQVDEIRRELRDRPSHQCLLQEALPGPCRDPNTFGCLRLRVDITALSWWLHLD